MKRGALKRSLSVLLLVGVLILVLFAAFSFAETWSLISPLNTTGQYAYSYQNSVILTFNLTISSHSIGNGTSNNVSGFAIYFGQPGTWRSNVTNSSAKFWANDENYTWHSWSNNTEYQGWLEENNASLSYHLYDINEGVYNWTVGVNINGTVFFVNDNITLLVDLTPPNVSLILPVAGSYSGNLLITVSANDSFSGINDVAFGLSNSTANLSVIYMSNVVAGVYNYTLDTTSLTDGPFNISIAANDIAGGKNESYYVVQIVIDNTPPNVSLILPVAGNYSGSLVINASVNDSLSGINLTQYRFESPGYVSSWVAMRSHDAGFYNATNITASLPDRRYNISINATDNAGKQTKILNATQITVDNTAPSVGRIFINLTPSSSNDTVANSGTLTVNATILDNGTGVANVTFRYENGTSTGNWTQMSLSAGYYLGAIDLSTLAEGRYNFTIKAADYMNFSNSTVKYSGNFSVDRTPPSTHAVVGSIGDSDNDGNIELLWTDDSSEPSATYIILRSAVGNITSYNSSLVNNLTYYNRIASGVQHFEDNTTTADNATPYWYAIMTVDAAGNANFTENNTFIGVWPWNSTANDTIKPKIPMGLDCSDSSSSIARLRWLSVYQDTSGNAEASDINYKVYINRANISVSLALINLSLGSGSGFDALTSWFSNNYTSDSVSATGVYHYIVVSRDDRGNDNLTVNMSNYCNVSLTYTTGNEQSSSSSSGGGDTGGGTPPPVAGIKVSHDWQILGTGTTTMAISKAGIDFTEVAFTIGTGSSFVEVSVLALAAKPSSVNAVASERHVYQYLQIDKTNLPDSYINKVVIKFKLEKKKLQDNSASPGSVVLMRYNETAKKWADLATSLLDIPDPIYYYYQASSPGLSVFAIASKPAGEAATAPPAVTPAAPGANETLGNATAETPETKAPGKSHMKTYVIIAVCVFAVAGLGAAGYIFYKKKGGFGGLKVSRQPTMKVPSYKM